MPLIQVNKRNAEYFENHVVWTVRNKKNKV